VGFQARGRWRRGFDVFFGNNFHLHFSLSTLRFRKLTPAKKSKFFSSAAINLKIYSQKRVEDYSVASNQQVIDFGSTVTKFNIHRPIRSSIWL
jgi:hypothetical protein